MIRRLPGRRPGFLLAPEFLQAWLRGAGLEERLRLLHERLPAGTEPLERWDLWLELLLTLLRSPLPEELEESLLRAVQELGGGSLCVQAVPPTGRQAGLQGDFCGLHEAAAVLEAVRLAWAAVLSSGAEAGLAADGQVAVLREERAERSPGSAAASAPAAGPDPALLRLAELHHRLLQPDSTRSLQSLLDLRPWAPQEWASPDAEHEKRLLRAAQAAGRTDAQELLQRGREAWTAWAASPASKPWTSDAKAHLDDECRQLAGLPGAPGLASGTARLVLREVGASPRRGEILVCRRLPPLLTAAALSAAGLVTEQGGSLSYGAVLAARAGLPCVCGVRGAPDRIREGDFLQIDGQLGIVTVQPADGPLSG